MKTLQRLVLTLIKIYDLALLLNSLCIVIPHTVINLFWYLSEMNRCETLHIVTFHKIQIAAENEWKMTFCIRYELYEWMMTSFELVNVSSTFQRYINWVLQNFLNKFCSVYVNDILIFTDESLHQHQDYVQRVLLQLWEADLQIDIDKCEFEVKSIKYLKFILKVKKNVQMNP